MSDYLLNQLKQLASQNQVYSKIDQKFQKQANSERPSYSFKPHDLS